MISNKGQFLTRTIKLVSGNAPFSQFSNFNERISSYIKKSTEKNKNEPEKFDKYLNHSVLSHEGIILRRRMQGKYLAQQHQKKKDLEVFFEAYTDTVIEFKLYMLHTCTQSQEIDAIMNFYGVAYKRVKICIHIFYIYMVL